MKDGECAMKKTIRILFLAIVLIAVFCLNNAVFGKMYNSMAMAGSFTAKFDRATSIEQNKVLVIGGSASNFGFDSQLFEQLSGKPAVNLAVSAGIPLRVYMKAAELCVKPGDVILMPLEYAYYGTDFFEVGEEYVDMVNIDPNLKTTETFWGNLEYACVSFLRSFTKMSDCMLFFAKKAMNDDDMYVANSVDEYGDFCLHQDREPTYKRSDEEVEFTRDDQTIKQLNSFIDKMKEKDVTVYITCPAVDKQFVPNYEEYFSLAQQTLDECFPTANVFGKVLDFAYDADLFLDTAYHLRYENRKMYTESLFNAFQQATK